MKNKKTFNTTKLPGKNSVFSQAVISNGFIFVSGTTAINPSTGKIEEGFEQQARQCFINIQTILEEAGSRLDKIVKTTVYMVTGNDFEILNKVHADFFPENPPARSVPQVMPFPSNILISVECIATL